MWDGAIVQMLERDPVDVPLLIGADGPKGRAVSAELADGVFDSEASPVSDELPPWRILRKAIELCCGDRQDARAEGLLLPQAHLDLRPLPERRLDVPLDLDGEEHQPRAVIVERVGYPSFVSHALSTRNKRLDHRHEGASVYWLKLLLPVVEGGAITPIHSAAADHANGAFAALPFEDRSSMSLNLTVQLVRRPIGTGSP